MKCNNSFFAKAITYIIAGISCGLVCGGACLIFAWLSSLCDAAFRENPMLLFMLPITGVAVVLLYDYFRKKDDLSTDALFRYSHGRAKCNAVFYAGQAVGEEHFAKTKYRNFSEGRAAKTETASSTGNPVSGDDEARVTANGGTDAEKNMTADEAALIAMGRRDAKTTDETTDAVSIWLAPLIMFSTCAAYLTGGSLGRVGSALQAGGCLSVQLHRLYCRIRNFLFKGYNDAARRGTSKSLNANSSRHFDAARRGTWDLHNDADLFDATNQCFEAARCRAKKSLSDVYPVDDSNQYFDTVQYGVNESSGDNSNRCDYASQYGAGKSHNVNSSRCCNANCNRNLFLACGMAAGFTAMLNTPVAGAIFGVEVLILTESELLIIIPALISTFITWFMAKLFHISYVDLHINPTDFSELISGKEDFIVVLSKILIVAFACTLIGRLYAYGRTWTAKAFAIIPNKIVRVLVGTGLVVIITLLIGETWYNGIGFIYVREVLNGNGSMLSFIFKLLLTTITLGCGIRGGDISPSIFIGATSAFALGSLIGLDPGMAAAIGIVGTLGSVTKCPIAIFVMGLEMLCCSTGSAMCFALAAITAHLLSGTYGIYHQQHSENQFLKPRIK